MLRANALTIGCAVFMMACGRTQMPDPRAVAQEYQHALANRDAQALHALLAEEAQRAYSIEDLEGILEKEGDDLSQRAEDYLDPKSTLHASATIWTRAGQSVELELEEPGFRVVGAGALPLQPSTPEQVLDVLSSALDAGDIAQLVELLTAEAQGRFEEEFAGLASSLAERADALIEVRGNEARVELPDGRVLLMKRGQRGWRLEAIP